MKKILFIASVASKRNRLDGETIKNRVFEKFLELQKNIKTKNIDTDNYKKHKISIALKIIFGLFWCDKVIISCSDEGANKVLKFLKKINFKKETYYFVIGGRLSKHITGNRWDLDDYKRITKIFVESKILADQLRGNGIMNIAVVRNFRNVNAFSNKYKKTDALRFVFYGRVIKEKGIEKAIKLVNDLHNSGLKSTLAIYGQIKEDYLRQLTPYLNEYIQYRGEIKPNGESEYEILSNYDIFIFPTEYPGECLPGSLIDARIAGLAVFSSKWEYAKEFINDGEDGVIFNNNYNDMFSKAKMFFDDSFLSAIRKKSKKRAMEYSVEHVLSEPFSMIGGENESL